MSNLKTYLNAYWSFRRYIYEQLAIIPTYYNPTVKPSTTADKFLIVSFSEERIGKITYSFPRIFCISRTDPELIKLTELVNLIVENFESLPSGKKTITLYDYATNDSLGFMEVGNVRVGPALTYEEGYVHRVVDFSLKYVVEQRHL